jgi:hypothetical protein
MSKNSNTEDIRLRAWNNKVQNDLPGSIAGIGYMMEQQRQFLQDCFEAVLKHQELTDNRFQDLDKLTQAIAEKYTAIQVQQVQHHREVRDLVHSMETRYAELSTKLTELNSKLTELENKLDVPDEEPEPEPQVKTRTLPWIVSWILLKADVVAKVGDTWKLLREDTGETLAVKGSFWDLRRESRKQLKRAALEAKLKALK